MSSFNSFHLHPNLIKALAKLNIDTPTPVQSATIPAAIDNKDLMVCSQTGSGKTIAFLLPMLHILLNREAPNTSTRTLILLPTRELALQTDKSFKQLAAFTSIKSGLIIGGEAFKYQIATLRKNPELIIATPGRLVEHIEKGSTDLTDVEILVLDEADRMLDMGFSEAMNTIAATCNKERTNWLFSATLQHKQSAKINNILQQPQSIVIDNKRTSNNHIAQQRLLADDHKHKEKLVIELLRKKPTLKTIIFCKTRVQCQQLGNLLKYKKLKAGFIHGEMTQSDRKQVLNRFRDHKINILVATDVAARGLDIDGIGLVINFTVAQSGDDHIHRVGRTGRAGKNGTAITLIAAEEWNQMASITRYLNIPFETITIKGLEAHFKGPKKLKSSGKASGKKRKVKTTGSNIPKKQQPKKPVQESGYGPLRKRR